MVIYTRTWIDRNLTRPQRQALVDWLLERTTNPTGKQILDGLRELLPHLGEDDLPSEQAVIGWRNKVWRAELSHRRIREQRDIAKTMANAGTGKDLDEANRVLLQSIMLEFLQGMHEGDVKDLSPELLKMVNIAVITLARQRQDEDKVAIARERADRQQADWEDKRKAAEKALNSADSDEEKIARMKSLFGMG